MYMIFATEGFFEVDIESLPDWDLSPRTTEFCLYTLIYRAIKP